MPKKLTDAQNIVLLGTVIDLLRKSIKIDSPYDVENWATDYMENHSNLWKTGKFKEEE